MYIKDIFSPILVSLENEREREIDRTKLASMREMNEKTTYNNERHHIKDKNRCDC